MTLCHYCCHAKDFTDDVLSHILSYCHYNDVNQVVTILQQQQQRMNDSGKSHPSYHEEEPQPPTLRWEYLHVWYELFHRDGYSCDDNDHHGHDDFTIPIDPFTMNGMTTTNYRKLYEYRKTLQQNLFGITSTTATSSHHHNHSNHESDDDDNDRSKSSRSNIAVTNQLPFDYSSLIRTTIVSPKTISVHDLLLSSSSSRPIGLRSRDFMKTCNIDIDDRHLDPQEYMNFTRSTTTSNGDTSFDFDFQLISNATGTSLLTIDQSVWSPANTGTSSSEFADDSKDIIHKNYSKNVNHNGIDNRDEQVRNVGILVSTLTLFPMLLQPSHSSTICDLIRMSHDTNYKDSSNHHIHHPPNHKQQKEQHHHHHQQQQQQQHSIILCQKVFCTSQCRMRMLPCQPLKLLDGNVSTIVGCWTQSDEWLEFRFWRVTYIRKSTNSIGHSVTTSLLEHSMDVSVEKYGFCRIQDSTHLYSDTVSYYFRSVDYSNSPHHRCVVSEDEDQPTGRIYIMATQENKYVLHCFRIQKWWNDRNNTIELDDLDDIHTPMIPTKECKYEIPISPMIQEGVLASAPLISGTTSLSDGSKILVVQRTHDIQLWNMTRTDGRGVPLMTHISVTECLQNLIGTYFHPSSLLYAMFATSVRGHRFRISYVPPLVGEKNLQIDVYGFFTFTLKSSPSQECLQVFWEFDRIALSWQISSIIVLPINNIRDLMASPQYHYDGQKLIVLGHDHLGYVLLIYEIFMGTDTETLKQSDDALSPQCRGRCEQSGGVYNFPDISIDEAEDNQYTDNATPTPKRRRRRIKFRKHIRHEALGIGRAVHATLMQMSCNERFIVVRIRDENSTDPDRIIYFDLDSSEFSLIR